MGPDHSDTARLHTFTVGDWLVDPRACHVSRGDTVVKLRPQLADLLCCLARRAGEIVLKDEILAEVWPGQYIAESGLSRCIAELRQILQDDVQSPRYIETITKRGYRLLAPVAWLEPAPHEGDAPQGRPPEPDVATSGATSPTAVAVEQGAADARRKRSRRVVWAAATLVLLAAGASIVVLLLKAPAGVLTERDTVLLADVRNTTRDPVFDDTLRLALAVNLEQAPFLHILPEDIVHAALVRTGRSPDEPVVGAIALNVCRREGAAVLLSGSIAPLGSRYVIGIEAVACGSGEVIGRALTEADRKEQVLGALQQAATGIRSKLGESRASLRQYGVPLERATTPSLEALKCLTLGDDNRDHARLTDALALYRQATEIDPVFALAWARRGAVARNLGLGEEMIPAFRRAYDLRDRVSQPERFYIEAHYYRIVEGSPEKALQIYEAWKRMYPGSVIPPTNIAGLLNGMLGQYDAAVAHGREAVRLAPGSSIAYRNLVLAYLGAGRIAEARQAIADAVKRGADDRLLHRVMLNVALFDGDREAFAREVQWAARDPMTALEALRVRASSAMGAGRLAEGRRLWAGALATAAEIGPGSRVAEVRLDQAECEALLGDPREARVAVDAALAADSHPLTLATAARILALVGVKGRAASLLDVIARQSVPDPGSLVASLPAARALVEAMQGRRDSALEALQPSTRFARGADNELVPLGVAGMVHMHVGQPSDAAVAFGDLIRLRALKPSSPWVAFARLQLARALRESGNRAGALAAYDSFLESWKEADPRTPLLDVARRERAAVAAA